MSVDQESVSRILAVLSHPLRRQILLRLDEEVECTFTDLATFFKVDTGKLSFHLRSLEAFLEQPHNNKYRLSRVGQNAIALIKDLETWAADPSVKKTFRRSMASWERRTVAFLADVATGLLFFASFPIIFSLLTAQPTSIATNFVFSLMLFWLYLSLLEGFRGQTLGKLLLGIKVVGADGRDLSYDRAAIRNFGKAFLLPIDLAIGLAQKDRRFIRYFDKFAGTVVIDLRAPIPESPEDQPPEKQPADDEVYTSTVVENVQPPKKVKKQD